MDREERLRKAVLWLKKKDPITKRIVQSVGPCTHKPVGTPYYTLVRSVISQQLSVKAASTMESRVIEYYGNRNRLPEPSVFLKLSKVQMRKAGLSFAKIDTIKRIAHAYEEGHLSDKKLKKLEDKEVLELLCGIKGIGPWTAEMVLMFSLDRWDHFSLNDLILRKSIETHYGISKDSKKEILEFASGFSPYRTIFSWYLWRAV
ncbi:DNA-3-methyladenine glycosylase 2 family protein [Leptospira wolffii]|uniref:DNA-3-methyladenine glycosylase II n=1 Tax=Leptospira wolffii TaxID=409998 RepID=A0A2M9ZDT6_9LEPT|nr:DNA-3-methyladenine glycosylase [Leptospira wolffii]PJZ66593.1 DNA-3-methyladenine glycosylase [Leptospira wolffii]TGK61568.1 DNA-3-methyladenine glycosylase 2 family protein [Leptospira wolffii]TGK70112.1 DNA-3-methyladenine glycosylase 2 family protein [Leptospira wolffii]TGK77035.1 DNA-3-methyladenine glycosylase 2 family protein [Leptospira wolffii]TGL31113.1 DNA-3-methyladenine glycosylase 2 family protein [Leptospira wolffii]